MIRLDDVTVTFPDGDATVTAVDAVTLSARAGTVTGITGPSGSGKSTLLAVAATLVTPTSGRVVIDDTDTADLSREERSALRRQHIGIVFQQPNLLHALTARDQLLLLADLDGRLRPDRAGAARRADELLDAVGLAERRHRRPSQLSGGERQRVNIARALMNGPSVLLVDEPTSALDTERGAAVMDLLVRLTEEQGTATLLVTHDLTHLPRLHATVRMVDGRMVDARSGAGAAAGQA